MADPRTFLACTYTSLWNNAATAGPGAYPLHMPGHKRRLAARPRPELLCLGHNRDRRGRRPARGRRHFSRRHGPHSRAVRCPPVLVSGGRQSTVGLLAGIRALAPFGSEVIAARNCHKAVYHAIELGRLTAHYLPAAGGSRTLACTAVCRPAAVAAALDRPPAGTMRNPDQPDLRGRFERYCVPSPPSATPAVCRCWWTRPTGHTTCPLPPGTAGSGGAVAAGADLVVQSAHKTLPSLTQTAFLQLNGGLADPAEVERQLDVFETSSPSYPLHGQSGRLHPTGWPTDGDAAFAALAGPAGCRLTAAVAGSAQYKSHCAAAQDALTGAPGLFCP